jgi:hypothetical protein
MTYVAGLRDVSCLPPAVLPFCLHGDARCCSLVKGISADKESESVIEHRGASHQFLHLDAISRGIIYTLKPFRDQKMGTRVRIAGGLCCSCPRSPFLHMTSFGILELIVIVQDSGSRMPF